MKTLTRQPASWVDEAPVQFVARREISASPAAIWTIIADHERWPEWFKSLRKVTVTGAAEGIGGQRRVVLATGGLVIDEVFTEWTPGKVFAFSVTGTSRGGLRSMNEHVRLTRSPTGTAVEYRMAIDPIAPFAPVARLARRSLEKNIGVGLDGLAALVE